MREYIHPGTHHALPNCVISALLVAGAVTVSNCNSAQLPTELRSTKMPQKMSESV